MSYSGIASLAGDGDLYLRLLACAYQEEKPSPEQWVADRRWMLALTPGWADAWDAAVAADVERPGWDPSVITDSAILSAIQPLE